MMEKSCRCGDSKQNFNMDIGPFFIGECCEKKGYNEQGELSGEQPKVESPVQEESPAEQAATAQDEPKAEESKPSESLEDVQARRKAEKEAKKQAKKEAAQKAAAEKAAESDGSDQAS